MAPPPLGPPEPAGWCDPITAALTPFVVGLGGGGPLLPVDGTPDIQGDAHELASGVADIYETVKTVLPD